MNGQACRMLDNRPKPLDVGEPDGRGWGILYGGEGGCEEGTERLTG